MQITKEADLIIIVIVITTAIYIVVTTIIFKIISIIKDSLLLIRRAKLLNHSLGKVDFRVPGFRRVFPQSV